MDAVSTECSERWLPIPGYEGLYEVSDLGRVRRLTFRNGHTNRPYQIPRILKPGKASTGYLQVCLCKNNVIKRPSVHRLVLLAFRGLPPPGMIAAHNNGVRDDDRLDNLRWATWEDNAADMVLHGTDQGGARNHEAILSDEQVLDIRQRRLAGERTHVLAKEYGVTWTTISEICLHRSWTRLPGSPPPAPNDILGERNCNAKLDPNKVRTIRKLRRTGMTYKSLGEDFGVSKRTIGAVVTRQTWRHVS